MGIGEPLDNYENLVKAIKIINSREGINLGMRQFTVSTCGLVKKINDVIKDLPQCNLTISLHAPNDKIRNLLIPMNHLYNVKSLILAAKKYIKLTNNKICFQYTLIRNVNDSKQNAEELSNLLRNLMCHVIVISYNKIPEINFLPSKNEKQFIEILKKNKISVSHRQKIGKSINAACGTMRSLLESHKSS
jgi:23S rRNA (adenine2503-C2)-methyltransferase